MPKTETKVTKIECDNQACPGHQLKKNDPTGWLFVTAEVYKEPPVPPDQLVFCSYSCGAASMGAADA